MWKDEILQAGFSKIKWRKFQEEDLESPESGVSQQKQLPVPPLEIKTPISFERRKNRYRTTRGRPLLTTMGNCAAKESIGSEPHVAKSPKNSMGEQGPAGTRQDGLHSAMSSFRKCE